MSKYYVTYKDMVELFLDGATEGLSGGTSHNRNLKIKGDLLIHYDTTIAEKADSKIIINDTHYSLQSSKLQKILRETVPNGKQVLLKDVEKGYGGKLSILI